MRRLAWVLWLFIALLPLRGIAQAAMSASLPEPAAMTMAADSGDAPCPMQGDAGTACTQCDLCCAVVALAPDGVAAAAGPAMQSPFVAGLGQAPPAPPHRLYRPPR